MIELQNSSKPQDGNIIDFRDKKFNKTLKELQKISGNRMEVVDDEAIKDARNRQEEDRDKKLHLHVRHQYQQFLTDYETLVQELAQYSSRSELPPEVIRRIDATVSDLMYFTKRSELISADEKKDAIQRAVALEEIIGRMK